MKDYCWEIKKQIFNGYGKSNEQLEIEMNAFVKKENIIPIDVKSLTTHLLHILFYRDEMKGLKHVNK